MIRHSFYGPLPKARPVEPQTLDDAVNADRWATILGRLGAKERLSSAYVAEQLGIGRKAACRLLTQAGCEEGKGVWFLKV